MWLLKIFENIFCCKTKKKDSDKQGVDIQSWLQNIKTEPFQPQSHEEFWTHNVEIVTKEQLGHNIENSQTLHLFEKHVQNPGINRENYNKLESTSSQKFQIQSELDYSYNANHHVVGLPICKDPDLKP